MSSGTLTSAALPSAVGDLHRKSTQIKQNVAIQAFNATERSGTFSDSSRWTRSVAKEGNRPEHGACDPVTICLFSFFGFKSAF